MNNMRLRNTTLEDLDIVMDIYKSAREYMKKNGNPTQWGDFWPSPQKIKEDIERNISFVVVDESNVILAVFAFVIGVDKTYLVIKEGKWLSNKTYGTVHRLASSQKAHNIFFFIQSELERLHRDINFRIDTHEDNIAMRKAISKCGYSYCGIINPIEGGDRLAFEKVIH